MIDLRNRALPDAINVKGRAYKIYTDYRVWLNYAKVISSEGKTLRDIAFVFVDEIPPCNFWDELLAFYQNPNATPNDISSPGDDTLYDYIEDGEYIYASFMKDYGIDLIDTDMHWWKFKALFTSLSEDTKMAKIMGYRGYKKPAKSDTIDSSHAKLKRIWSLDERITDEERKALEEFNAL